MDIKVQRFAWHVLPSLSLVAFSVAVGEADLNFKLGIVR